MLKLMVFSESKLPYKYPYLKMYNGKSMKERILKVGFWYLRVFILEKWEGINVKKIQDTYLWEDTD